MNNTESSRRCKILEAEELVVDVWEHFIIRSTSYLLTTTSLYWRLQNCQLVERLFIQMQQQGTSRQLKSASNRDKSSDRGY